MQQPAGEEERRLRELSLPRTLDTSRHNLAEEFFNPLLSISTQYLRGVGYFTSGWLRQNAVGLSRFAENGGKCRMIVSPILVDEDWKAITTGSGAHFNPQLYDALKRTVHNLETELTSNQRNALAWLVADQVIEFRLAFPRDKLSGEFHDKFGVFKDQYCDVVSFNGSYNETEKGSRNYESIKIFVSWLDATREWVIDDEERFERLWSNSDPNVEVVALPEAIERQITTYCASSRPYTKPPDSNKKPGSTLPEIPLDLKLRNYQEQAIQAWFRNRGQGILRMATGTGKTATALCLLTTLSKNMAENQRGVVAIVVCPYRHLVDQWVAAASKFHMIARRCYESRHGWWRSVSEDIATWNLQSSGVLLLVVTNATYRNEHFQALVEQISATMIVVADEVHNLGSQQLREALPERAKYRLGLSATPERYGDEEGTTALERYFGEVVFEYGLAEAISDGVLSKYEYFPVLVALTEEEQQDYLELTKKIGQRVAMGGLDVEENSALQSLLIRRARLLGSAKNKVQALKDEVSKVAPLTQCLFYCGDGTVEGEASRTEQRQIDKVLYVLGHELNLKVDQYTADTTIDRRKILLRQLGSGVLDGLVAIRCLDEGVDMPEVRNAFIMASSTNPREFIQRRGRVLRRAPGKDRARIWDFIVQPPTPNKNSETFKAERTLVRREISRAVQFAELADNGPQARAQLRPLMKTYNLLDS